MNCNPLRSEPLTINGGSYNIRIISSPCVSECCNFINIDAESCHGADKILNIGYGYNWLNKTFVTKLHELKFIMSLKQQIDNDIKKAMLAKNKEELEALRAIKSLILLAETDKSAGGDVSAETENKLLQKAVKQRKESADIFTQQGRKDLADRENFQLDVISRYLPKQLSEEEIVSTLKSIIDQVGAKGPQDMGKVMGNATKALSGKADGKVISELVKKLLAPWAS